MNPNQGDTVANLPLSLQSATLIGRVAALLDAVPANESCLIVTPRQSDATFVAQTVSAFRSKPSCLEFPTWDLLPFEMLAPSRDVSGKRNLARLQASRGSPFCMVCSAEALLLSPFPFPVLEALTHTLTVGDPISKNAAADLLLRSGFLPASPVQEVGDLVVHGDVIDFFPPSSSLPVRLEFYANTLRNIRLFRVEDQRSCAEISQIEVIPVIEHIFPIGRPSAAQEHSAEVLAEYLNLRAQECDIPLRKAAALAEAVRSGNPPGGIEWFSGTLGFHPSSIVSEITPTHIALFEPDKIHDELALYASYIQERTTKLLNKGLLIPDAGQCYAAEEAIWTFLESHQTFRIYAEVAAIQTSKSSITKATIPLSELRERIKSSRTSGRGYRALGDFLNTTRNQGFSIALVLSSENRIERLQRILAESSIDAEALTKIDLEHWIAGLRKRIPVAIVRGHLEEGAVFTNDGYLVVGERDIFGEVSSSSSAHPPVDVKRLISSLSQLEEGDFVVHVDYGIGIYRGFRHLVVAGVGSDLLQIEYADSTLYLPLVNVSKIQKYQASEGSAPRLDKLSSQKWKKTKAKVRAQVELLAGDLIQLYASRAISGGYAFEGENAQDEAFADTFPHSETADQRKAIEDTLADMAQARPMDRLICGDVGFGKTEVALRAAYKAVQHKKQVAFLAPTTLLVEQHRETILTRFSDFPVTVGALSRFYSPESNRKTLKALEDGALDIVVGTQKLLQRDVQFFDLGLLIIDEEHRFGVRQKERLKQLRKSVDVLSLTATPIPRTLHMSLLNLRDMSVIGTPPTDRRAIKTIVAPKEEEVIRDAIMKELQRDGQVFYVFNRVEGIEPLTAALQDLVPEARVTFAHGQMPERLLEKIMVAFLQRDVDVLVATTIIESGLDIPNANTMLIDRPDALGLAQLYQLRGRIGRSARQATCYLLSPGRKRLSAHASRRLEALQMLDHLGHGFQLAVRDLEIRGAGNLLGKEQSGNISSIGFELFSKILAETVADLKQTGYVQESEVEPELRIALDAYIPEVYVPDISERLILYQRLSALRGCEEKGLLVAEIEDRFGPPPAPVVQLFELMAFRASLRRFQVVRIDMNTEKAVLSFGSRTSIRIEDLVARAKAEPERIKLGRSSTITVRFPEGLTAEGDFAARATYLEELLGSLS